MSCTRESHAATQADPVAWGQLLKARPWIIAAEGDEHQLVLEVRECPACMSTLAVEIRS